MVATAIAVLLVISRRFDTLSNGLRGQYFPNSDWSGAPAKTVVDAAPSAASLLQAMSDDGAPEQFSVAWTGYLIAPWDGAYTFATTSDDGSAYVYRLRRTGSAVEAKHRREFVGCVGMICGQ